MKEIIQNFNDCISEFGECITKGLYKEVIKIKDDVDLNELVKYRFIFNTTSGKYVYNNFQGNFIEVNSWDRLINCRVETYELMIILKLYNKGLIEISKKI